MHCKDCNNVTGNKCVDHCKDRNKKKGELYKYNEYISNYQENSPKCYDRVRLCYKHYKLECKEGCKTCKKNEYGSADRHCEDHCKDCKKQKRESNRYYDYICNYHQKIFSKCEEFYDFLTMCYEHYRQL